MLKTLTAAALLALATGATAQVYNPLAAQLAQQTQIEQQRYQGQQASTYGLMGALSANQANVAMQQQMQRQTNALETMALQMQLQNAQRNRCYSWPC